MIEFVENPIRKVYINIITEMSIEEICNTKRTPQGNMPLFWADGVLLSLVFFPPIESFTREHAEGIVRWGEVQYALLDEFPKAGLPTANGMEMVPVRDTSNLTLHKELAAWLKKRREKK